MRAERPARPSLPGAQDQQRQSRSPPIAVILGGRPELFSRPQIGWALKSSLATALPLAVLHVALGRRPGAGLFHHSNRGCQYACADYLATLAEHGDISRQGNCYDNATMKRLGARSNTS
jgi:transposase InsO family protein